MCKQEFLAQLRQGLSGLPQEDIEERLTFYSEMLDDRIEEGLSEEDAVAQIGTVEKIVSQIMSEIPLTKLVKEKVKPKRALRAWEIVLLILGSPIWLSLLIAAAAVVLSVYAAIWSVMLSLWAVAVGTVACALGGLVIFAVFVWQGNVWQGAAMLGAGLACAGISILLFFGCKPATEGIVRLTKKIILWMKSRLVGEGEAE